VIAAPADGTPQARARNVRLAGGLMLLLWAALIALAPSWNARLPSAGFDAWQTLLPRTPESFPVTVIDIDEKSLATLGRWPWPRTLVARLVDDLNKAGPAAIGVDMFMPEADPRSPEHPLASSGSAMEETSNKLAMLPSNDAVLAAALSRARSVLAVAGLPDSAGMTLRVVPVLVRDASASFGSGTPQTDMLRFAGALTSVDELNRAASGWGLISTGSSSGPVRRIPLVASIDGTLVPAFAVEMIRLAAGARALRLEVSGSAVAGIAAGPAFIPTEADGAARIYFSPRRVERLVSAVDVLEGRVDPDRIRGRLVLVGVSGIGLSDYHQTPLGVAMPGTEIQAQLLENILGGTLLMRPAWAPAFEAALFLLLGTMLVLATPTWRPASSAMLAVGCFAAPLVITYVAFRWHRLVLDAATPSLGILLLFGAMLVLTLAEAMRQKRALERAVQAERERSARMAGELDAARRIQMAFLPDARQFRDDPRIDVAAAMEPAREVGGDLYDFFRLDNRRLFFIVGDVAGKGLSASIFMAISKALYKSAALRSPSADIGVVMAEANAEVSRDNPQLLFVTAFAGILDLDSGELAYCNAGHENPFVVDPRGGPERRLEDGGGPPLCAVDAFAYRSARDRLRGGEILCVVSDGITEAHDRGGALYGSARICAALRASVERGAPRAGTVAEALRHDVELFAAGTEPADDKTVLVLRWNGPGHNGIGQVPGAV
jgi:CHASE2 domain-containing sensor protein/serine phosphatase RsbU (regulator of sigma subunit)